MDKPDLTLEEWLYGRKFCNLHNWTLEDVIYIYASTCLRRSPGITKEQAINRAKALIEAKRKSHIPDLEDIPDGWKVMEDMAK